MWIRNHFISSSLDTIVNHFSIICLTLAVLGTKKGEKGTQEILGHKDGAYGVLGEGQDKNTKHSSERKYQR